MAPDLKRIDDWLETAAKHVASLRPYGMSHEQENIEAAAANIEHARRGLREEALKLCDGSR